MKYTVKQAQSTGKLPHPTYGGEYQVQFNEDERIVVVNRKAEPMPGDEWNGEITSNQYGNKFKKDPFVPQPGTATVVSTSQPETTYVPYAEKRNDGARQGMCVNNAAASLVGVDFKTDKEWAEAVHGRATELFNLGDLLDTQTTTTANSVFDN